MLSSEAIEANIRDKAEKLESFYDKIMGCRVLVEAPHHHHRAGQRYHVRIDLTVPGREIVIKRAPRLITAKPLRSQKDANGLELEESREPSKYAVHDDILLAIRDAFDAARRKLQDYARRERGVVKVHEGSPPMAELSKFFRKRVLVSSKRMTDGKSIFTNTASWNPVSVG